MEGFLSDLPDDDDDDDEGGAGAVASADLRVKTLEYSHDTPVMVLLQGLQYLVVCSLSLCVCWAVGGWFPSLPVLYSPPLCSGGICECLWTVPVASRGGVPVILWDLLAVAAPVGAACDPPAAIGHL